MSDAFSDPNTMGELRAEIARLRTALSKQNDEICQVLGSALGYPKFCDDQANFPGTTEANGVCVGDHVAESIAAEAAGIISENADGHARKGRCLWCGFPMTQVTLKRPLWHRPPEEPTP